MALHAAHWGAFYPEVRNGRLVSVRPFEKDTDPSPLLSGLVEHTYHPTRIMQPAVRVGWRPGERGTSRTGRCAYRQISWDEALSLVASEIRRVGAQSGNQSIFAGSYGWSSAGRFHHAKTQLKRFFNCIGGYVGQVNNYSFGAGMVLLPHVVGDIGLLSGQWTHWESLVRNTELFLAFGGLPARNTQIESGGCGAHKHKQWMQALLEREDCELLNVSPIQDDFPQARTWCAIRPGTDTALLLALCYCLLRDGTYDKQFVARYTDGFVELSHYLRTGVAGTSCSPEWAAGICQVPTSFIEDLAKRIVTKRTFIAMNWSLQRADHGEQPFWAAVALAALIGQIGLPGGGVSFGYGSMNGVGNNVRKFKTPALPTQTGHESLVIPVARVADLLLKTGQTYAYNGKELHYPDIRLVYWAGGNPFHHHQDLFRLEQGWQKPETVIVHETHWTSTARRADIVLPATTTLERNDIGTSSSDNFMIAMQKAIDPVGQAHSDYDIFSDLSVRMGFGEQFTEGRDEQAWLRALYKDAQERSGEQGVQFPTFEAFWEQGYLEIPQQEIPYDALSQFRADPLNHALDTESGRIQLFSQKIAAFGYKDCPGHPAWLEKQEWLGGALAQKYPFHLLSTQPATRLHGQLDAVGPSRASKVKGREQVRIHPDDARSRGIQNTDIVKIFNDRGACLAAAHLSDTVIRGVIQLPTGAWFEVGEDEQGNRIEIHGNPNVLTPDRGTSELSQGCSAQSTLVDMCLYHGPLPELTVHTPPSFVHN